MKKDMKELMKALEAQGFELELAKSGHWKVRKNGALVATLAATPSEGRGFLNAIAGLRRHGFKWKGR